jgi:hypothetical protein
MADFTAPPLGSRSGANAPAPEEPAGGPDRRNGGPAFGLGQRPAPVRDDSSATIFIALVGGIAILAIVALIAGASGSPNFSIGLAFGVGIGAVPYAIFMAVRIAVSAGGDEPRKRRMTEEEWERVFGAGSRTEGASSQANRGGTGRTGWSRASSAVDPEAALQQAYDLLGLSSDSSMREVRASYHRQAQRHHPDKVTRASEEARILAEQRMKKINAAYALIRQSRARAPA